MSNSTNDINWKRIYQGSRRVIIYKLGAYETNLSVMQSLFPNCDTSQEPQVNNPNRKSWILQG